MTQVLLDLAAYPEYQDPLKEEIETVLREFGGWKKQALTYMKKLDSVLRESQRMNGVAIGRLTCHWQQSIVLTKTPSNSVGYAESQSAVHIVGFDLPAERHLGLFSRKCYSSFRDELPESNAIRRVQVCGLC
jgi:hypothetical protein